MSAERTQELSTRLFDAMVNASELLTVELGRRLGLYELLLELGSVTVIEFATAAGIHPRYAREWLEQQAVAGILDIGVAGNESTREYLLPGAHVPVLVDPDSPHNMSGAGSLLAGFGETLAEVATAYRTGSGVGYERFGDALREGIAALNRPGFVHDIRDWIASMPDIAARLDAGGVVLDAGCGEGWSTIAMARAFPNAHVVGADRDEESIMAARANARAAGVADRTTFLEANADDEATLRSRRSADYTVVTVFEALHDMGEPIRALAAFRALLEPGGVVLVADERVADVFTAPGDAVERLNYAASVLHCLPATMDESTTIANGTVLRASTVRAWAAEAGFGDVNELPVDHDLWRFYRLG